MINIIKGCMKSGKSELLIKYALEIGLDNIICLKPALDDRFSATDIVSRNNNLPRLPAVTFRNYEDLRRSFLVGKIADAILIDETSLLLDSKFLVDAIVEANSLGYDIYLTSLNAWWTGEKPDILKRLDKLDNINYIKFKSKAICVVCGHKATMTYKKGGTDAIIEVGDIEYEPRCLKHFRASMQRKRYE